MDQIGFLVSHVSAEGFLRLHPVGAFDVRTLLSRRVVVCAENGEDLPGVLNLARRPIHTATPDELKKEFELSDLIVDLARPAEETRAKVRPGDMVVLDGAFAEVGDSIIGAGLDDRVGCWALIRAIESLSRHDCEIHAVWTAQEEVGSRGVEPVAFGVEADIGICCDTTVCCALPGVPEEQRVTEPGAGVSVQIADSSTLADMALVRDIERVARENDIKCQRSLMLGGGQDGAYIQRSRHGVRTLVLSCPIKYLHTTTEMASRDDLNSYRDLLAAYLSQLS